MNTSPPGGSSLDAIPRCGASVATAGVGWNSGTRVQPATSAIGTSASASRRTIREGYLRTPERATVPCAELPGPVGTRCDNPRVRRPDILAAIGDTPLVGIP